MATENGRDVVTGGVEHHNPGGLESQIAASKPKRVRTGCLTCRERHLKCDEAMPHCMNCRKSNRVCRRGVKLNFIDVTCHSLPRIAPSEEWNVEIVDESRDIASDYKDGLEKYAPLTAERPPRSEQSQLTQNHLNFDFGAHAPPAPAMTHQELPSAQGAMPYPEQAQPMMFDPQQYLHYSHHSSTDPSIGRTSISTEYPAQAQQAYVSPEESIPTPEEPSSRFLTNQEEVLLMQVFVEEVGLWMDSMDPHKHFSRILPFHALKEPMLLNAFLACGARHLTLVNPAYPEDKALHYYDTATTALLRSLQNPDRDTVVCATTAVILNVYEVMSERALQRMNHIAGARALVKECGWNAQSKGVGAACFWLNVGMELLSCLHFNWKPAWDPDDWGVDMDFSHDFDMGREEIWTYRIVYITAKVANFRATIPRFQEASPRNEQMRQQERYGEWCRLRQWAESWHNNAPRTMHPMGFLYPYQTTSNSAFPEVWLIKRTSIVARLFYHTAMCLIFQINPLMPKDIGEMAEKVREHSVHICGIVAHVKDRGVASVALRSLHIAAECLALLREQKEVLEIINKIKKETGWRVDFMHKDLKKTWGWVDDQPPPPPQQQQQQQQQSIQQIMQQQQQQQQNPSNYQKYQNQPQTPPNTSLPPAPPPTLPKVQQQQQTLPQARKYLSNPLLLQADFSMPQHPYQDSYVKPNFPGAGVSRHWFT